MNKVCGQSIPYITSYTNTLYQKFVDGNIQRNFDPKKMNGNNMANYLSSFDRVDENVFDQRLDQVVKEISELPKESLQKFLKGMYWRIER